MTEITQCPECRTRFKVTDAQLDAHDGLVRCGHCHDVFNAREHLHDDEPSPQLTLPIDIESPANQPDLAPIPEVREPGENRPHWRSRYSLSKNLPTKYRSSRAARPVGPAS